MSAVAFAGAVFDTEMFASVDGTPLSSKAPMSHAVEPVPGRPKSRWSVDDTQLPASNAELVLLIARVGVSPPLSASEANAGSLVTVGVPQPEFVTMRFVTGVSPFTVPPLLKQLATMLSCSVSDAVAVLFCFRL